MAYLISNPDERDLTEEDVKNRYITPALNKAGWSGDHMLMEKYFFTDGRIIAPSKGKRVSRQPGNKADYILFAKPNLPIAIVEAKGLNAQVSSGIQQAIDYAKKLDLPFAFSTNGKAFCLHDFATGEFTPHIAMEDFPLPEELCKRYWDSRNLSPEERAVVDTPYCYGSEIHTPRYYQRIAINRTVEAVAKGAKRALLVMATGTGKTYTAFQIVHRLHACGLKKRILYLADRNILIDQTKAQDFKPFSKVMVKVQNKKMNAAFEIYMSLYGQWIDYDPNATKQPYEEFSKDFFDLIIVDECHRGSVRDDSEWKSILEYFAPATQIGMTATPKSVEGADNLDYFCKENDGNPLYVYSLKQGIEDGFLAPYRVTKSFLSIDLEGWQPEPGEQDLYGYLIDQRRFDRPQMGTKLAVKVRRELVARRIVKMLRQIGMKTKTIVFCPDQEEALAMRDLIAKLTPEECKKDSRYVMRITSDDQAGMNQLDNFIDPNEPYPAIVTTSKLLETGVDCKTCGLIVIDKEVDSMTIFKQIVGRGTRINEKKGKYFFDILDFRNVTSKFVDKDFDGIFDTKGTISYAGDEDTPGDDDVEDPPGPYEPNKFHILGPAGCKIVHERVEIIGPDGKLSTMSVKDFTRNAVRRKYATLESFLTDWSSAERKQAILDTLEEMTMPDLIKLVQDENPALKSLDAFDVILHLAFDQKPLTRKERAENVKKRNYLAKYEGKAREILEEILRKYSENEITDVENVKYLSLPPFKQIGTGSKIASYFGGQDKFNAAIKELEYELYLEVA